MASVCARDSIRILPSPLGGWHWVRDRRRRWSVLREWSQRPCPDRETALLDALQLLPEDASAPRRARLLLAREPGDAWHQQELTPFSP